MNTTSTGSIVSEKGDESAVTAPVPFFRDRRRMVLFLLATITLLGAWLRLTHFADWVHFELDQARDFALVSDAVTYGPANLPLLGPKASGTTLRLGPAFYYLQYLSALVFGNTPEGQVLFVALLSIASIPLLFFLLRRVFDDWISLGLTLLYAGSAFFVLSARFGWNPNPLPFFLLLGALALLRATDGDSRHPGRWLVLSAGSSVIATQLHFLSFVMVPISVVAFLLIRRPRYSWKAWAGVVLVTTVIFAPMIVNEWTFHGANTRAFFEAVGKKKSEKPMAENLVTNVVSQAESYMLLLTGNDHIFLPNYALKDDGWKRSCGDHCKDTGKALSRTTFWFFTLGSLWLLVSAVRRRSGTMVLLAVWYLSAFLVLTPVANNFAPRFFLLVAPLPFVMLGLPARRLAQWNRPIAYACFFVTILGLVFLNGRVIATRFGEMDRAGTERLKTSADHILGEPVRTTLSQERDIARFIADTSRENGFPVFIGGESFCRRSIVILTEREGVPVAYLEPSNVRTDGNAFIVVRSDKKGDSLLKPYRDTLEVAVRREFGTLSVYVLSVRAGAGLPGIHDPVPLADILFGDRDHRITWRGVSSGAFGNTDSGLDEDEE